MDETILQSIGRTPLVRLNRITQGLSVPIAIKVEANNPGGSVKDRVALAMVREAERLGQLRAGGTIIEATAGNTGVGLAMVAAVRGYRCIFVLPDKMAPEKIALLKGYGAEVVITPTNVPPDAPESYNGVADRLAREIPGAWRPNQFANLANPEIHYRTTGPEIWQQTEGRITAFVSGVGTGGTLSGVARYLKEMNPEIRIIGADPEGSVLSGGTPKSWKVEGIGEDFVPRTFNSQLVDEWIRISDAESFETARQIARQEGMLLGGSTGTNVAAALRYARRLDGPHLIVALGCDTGRNYLSKFYDDRWLADNQLTAKPTIRESIDALLQQRGPRELLTISPEEPLTHAIALMQRRGISQLPVVAEGKSVGSIQEVTLARVLHDRLDPGQVRVGEIMARPLPILDSAVQLDEAYRLLLAGNTGVLITHAGNLVDILTRIDLIQHWGQPR
ncbi:pyridoxal-phosphate dependent enzyme [Tuwongella immobilis]|uniref:CBS domain-containing protein n=1 Tax=Tuwongella immobilis TaxID=692036 RepID=A0A6C2YUV2_9BACT|nr:pyridoxal-phosphate dependent enzyme [Tuwongella immobilis]VIP04652.1 cystathionine beta-synthase : Cystathionine beta-synthase OS=Singulisphaera acidiphila (strain ATCC BAA-1392 / DSM 18658 / VKM B-2454 / MOB10) GN=Sinac_7195 PE=4 SV=1: PALP: CBS [Tuwongella immobilis]VTS06665.1 cystathionine beta-synthase : Cystathionine beta-synthase OS=Singulisphaera acidiphila (strain ATCC BAA-1392 / DSM 18658 / VKM B-2454 / MOB10) GN=Sinac_7195 PE=4 SV=1: PALP: CBS [Tuwongella immobilis]